MMPTALMLLLLAAPQPPNLINNASMELWHPSGLVPVQWGAWTPDAQRTTWRVDRDSNVKQDGMAAMRLSVDDWLNVFAGIDVLPEQTYTLSVYVRADRPVKVGLRMSAWGHDVADGEREKNRKQPSFDIEPGKWQRISVTDTMPAGTERATAYIFLRGEGVYHLDAAMANAGPLVDFAPGRQSKPIAPLVGSREAGEVAFTPQLWNADGEPIAHREVAFAFDTDVLSAYRLHSLPGAIGATFDEPVVLRGLSLLLHDAEMRGAESTAAIHAMRDGVWTTIPSEVRPIGVVQLVEFKPVEVDAIRIRFTSPLGVMRIYHIGFMQ